MKIKLILSAIITISLFTGCEKMSEMKQAADNVQQLGKNAENMQKNMDAAEARREERRKRGDTLAIPYQELQKFLPESISGYTPQDPDGSTMNAEGGSYSSASRRYVKSGADGSEEAVEVSIVDYNATATMFTALTAMWGTNFSMEDANGYTKSFDPGLQNSIGWEHYDKNNKSSELSYALGDRFIVTIRSANQANNDFAKSIGKSMNLSGLAAK